MAVNESTSLQRKFNWFMFLHPISRILELFLTNPTCSSRKLIYKQFLKWLHTLLNWRYSVIYYSDNYQGGNSSYLFPRVIQIILPLFSRTFSSSSSSWFRWRSDILHISSTACVRPSTTFSPSDCAGGPMSDRQFITWSNIWTNFTNNFTHIYRK